MLSVLTCSISNVLCSILNVLRMCSGNIEHVTRYVPYLLNIFEQSRTVSNSKEKEAAHHYRNLQNCLQVTVVEDKAGLHDEQNRQSARPIRMAVHHGTGCTLLRLPLRRTIDKLTETLERCRFQDPVPPRHLDLWHVCNIWALLHSSFNLLAATGSNRGLWCMSVWSHHLIHMHCQAAFVNLSLAGPKAESIVRYLYHE